MDLAEEIEKPLPVNYFTLLNRKMIEGIIVKRLAFRSKTDFEVFNTRQPIESTNYQCVLATSTNCKRMLLIDRKYLFFRCRKRREEKFLFYN